ncbi:hypothetical protein L218DRAFT_1016084 [Marasmius fiardii PR-910]|nr:hypothetical protein L218DRAFT_1016084 [Marasmius fiardii PR-910]
MADSWTNGLLLKITNVICYFIFLGSHIYTLTFPTGNPKLTYITPAPWAFLIWIIIHILLIGTIIYQFFPAGKLTIVDGMTWRFPLLSILSAIYVYVWAKHDYIVTFVFSLSVSGTVGHIYYIVKKHHSPQSTADDLLIHLPISLYQGWTAVLPILNAFEAFGVNAVDHHPGVMTKFFVFLALLCLKGIAVTFTLKVGDLSVGIAIAWSLWAIFAEQRNSDPFIFWSALVFATISLKCLVLGVFLLSRKHTGSIALHGEERAPQVPEA